MQSALRIETKILPGNKDAYELLLRSALLVPLGRSPQMQLIPKMN
ncbi:hypothetical protein [Brasilonema sp. UFV-L1]|nr:hypothetical protein [Brasilonema sp. UFV-L1]